MFSIRRQGQSGHGPELSQTAAPRRRSTYVEGRRLVTSASTAPPKRSTVLSSHGRPRICIPMGLPSRS